MNTQWKIKSWNLSDVAFRVRCIASLTYQFHLLLPSYNSPLNALAHAMHSCTEAQPARQLSWSSERQKRNKRVTLSNEMENGNSSYSLRTANTNRLRHKLILFKCRWISGRRYGTTDVSVCDMNGKHSRQSALNQNEPPAQIEQQFPYKSECEWKWTRTMGERRRKQDFSWMDFFVHRKNTEKSSPQLRFAFVFVRWKIFRSPFLIHFKCAS